jgi:hypothetical protein
LQAEAQLLVAGHGPPVKAGSAEASVKHDTAGAHQRPGQGANYRMRRAASLNPSLRNTPAEPVLRG